MALEKSLEQMKYVAVSITFWDFEQVSESSPVVRFGEVTEEVEKQQWTTPISETDFCNTMWMLTKHSGFNTNATVESYMYILVGIAVCGFAAKTYSWTFLCVGFIVDTLDI